MLLVKSVDLFDFSKSVAGEYVASYEYPWECLSGLKDYIISLQSGLSDEYEKLSDGVYAHKTAKIAPTAYIGAPTIICEGAEVRHCAYVRGGAIIGKGAVVGNSTELKNVILFDGVQVPHYNYVGDSILGFKAHMGAGAITSNLKSDRTSVVVKGGGERVETGLKKCGAFLGDFADVGCNSVLNPGTVIGRNTRVYPLTALRGAYPADSIVKSAATVIKRT